MGIYGPKYSLIVYVEKISQEALVLNEATYPGQHIGGNFSVRKDPPHTSKSQTHFHVFLKNNQVFAINKDGSAHDKSHGIRMPQQAVDGLKKKFPGLVIPPNNIIESIDISSGTDYDEFEIFFG